MSQLTVRRADRRRDFEPLMDLERFLSDGFPAFFSGPTVPGVPIDIIETDDSYMVEVDAPGVRREDLELTLERNQLTIGVNSVAEEATEGKRYLRRERARMHASRTVRFPTAIEAEGVSASFEDGVLRITAPKAASEKARRIDIG